MSLYFLQLPKQNSYARVVKYLAIKSMFSLFEFLSFSLIYFAPNYGIPFIKYTVAGWKLSIGEN